LGGETIAGFGGVAGLACKTPRGLGTAGGATAAGGTVFGFSKGVTGLASLGGA
jgi:hypothetical protein